jgi:tyrosyl-tRNA synthetase
MGGSDQWGNIVNGVELARRVDGQQVFGLTTPLLTNADGTKMGKTVGGAVWLNEDQLSHYDYWQFWRNTADADVANRLRLFTDLPMDEVARLAALEGAEINEAKKILANEATALCRGLEAATASAETARRTFEEGASDANLPTVSLGAEGLTVVQATTGLGFATSNKEVRRKLTEGAIKVNGETVTDPNVTLKPGDKLSFGAKKHGLVIG